MLSPLVMYHAPTRGSLAHNHWIEIKRGYGRMRIGMRNRGDGKKRMRKCVIIPRLYHSILHELRLAAVSYHSILHESTLVAALYIL